MAAPKLLLMDEPSLGLAPLIVREMFEAIKKIVASGTTVLLIEQNTQGALSAAHYGYVRYINTGGAPLFPEIQERFTRITGVPVMQGYGLTESSPTTPVNPLDRIKVGSIGCPLANTEDKIVNPGTGEELPPKEVGELRVRGPQVMKGYYRDPEATANTLVKGWLRTGDLGWKDEEGFVSIVDRLKELIKCQGFQVAPAETAGPGGVHRGHPPQPLRKNSPSALEKR